ncbi:MAG: ABC transporter ATP-binding protein [Actinomycetota bacterium]|nr:MAG: ABC transporter ATP-binding protein [Actinomycetota bacterium]
MGYGRTVLLDEPVDAVIPRVKEALKAQGFGVLTEIDVRATLKEKIGAEVAPYVILGACNPRLAHRALELEPEVGLLLPCNVVVREHDGRTVVSALDPGVIAELADHPDLSPIAEEATGLLDAALESLAGTAPTT